MHLTEEQLNEYLDEATTERVQIEEHLSSCDECAARLSTLQNVFTELDSLPELELTRDLAAPFTLRPSLPAQLPKFLTLTAFLQAAIALVALIVAVPFVSVLLPQIELPSFTKLFFQIQTQWTVWLDQLSTLALPTFQPINLPTLEMSSLLFTLAGVSVLWILGNGLLLRNQMK
ncbi:MAG: hypothetical protein JNM02_10835 [Anaerolineales bacterium]|nr:hypothetical protein [Anaerolineales bacterium]